MTRVIHIGVLALTAWGMVACSQNPWIEQDKTVLTVDLPEPKPMSAEPIKPLPAPEPVVQKPVTPKAQIFPGTGIFMNKAWSPESAEPAGSITLNFEDTDIREVIKVVVGDMLGENYVIDPAIKGAVTLQTGRPLSQPDLLPTLEALLRMNGAVITKDGGMYRILPMAAGATQGNVTPEIANRVTFLPKGYSVVSVPLRYVSVTEIEKLLKPLAPQNAILYSDTVRNLLMLAGTGDEIKHLLETIEIFDVNWMSGMSVGLFRIESVDAKVLGEELDKIFSSKQGPLTGVIRIIPIDRINSLLVVTPQRAYLNEVGSWIDRLDRGGESGSDERLHVYSVQNTKAEHLAEVLNEVFGKGGSTQSKKVPKAKVAPGLKGREIGGSNGDDSSSISSTSSAATRAGRDKDSRVATTGRESQKPLTVSANIDGSGNLESGSFSTTANGNTESSIQVGENVKIIADETNNALLILATPRDYDKIISAVRHLDVLPLQVLIEASIVEIKLTDDLKYGLQWFFNDKIGGKIGTSSLDGSIDSSTASGLGKIFPGFNYTLADSAGQVRAVLSALASDSKINVLSSPSIMVLDNNTAEIQVGDEVPISTQQQQSTSTASANIVNSIEYRKTGVSLSVTPRVNSSGLVTMEITQDVSNVAKTTTSGLDSPTINNRTINSTIVVQSGETIVLGGLIREDKSRTKSGIPVLYQLPVVGNLFGQTETKVDRTELIILITPRVVGSAADARQLTNELREKMQGLKIRSVVKPAAE